MGSGCPMKSNSKHSSKATYGVRHVFQPEISIGLSNCQRLAKDAANVLFLRLTRTLVLPDTNCLLCSQPMLSTRNFVNTCR